MLKSDGIVKKSRRLLLFDFSLDDWFNRTWWLLGIHQCSIAAYLCGIQTSFYFSISFTDAKTLSLFVLSKKFTSSLYNYFFRCCYGSLLQFLARRLNSKRYWRVRTAKGRPFFLCVVLSEKMKILCFFFGEYKGKNKDTKGFIE